MNIILSDLRSYYTFHEQSKGYTCIGFIISICLSVHFNVLSRRNTRSSFLKAKVKGGLRMCHDHDPESIGKGQGHFTIINMPTIKEWPLRGHQLKKKAASWYVLLCFPVLLIMTLLSKDIFSFLFNFTIVVKEILFANTTWD